MVNVRYLLCMLSQAGDITGGTLLDGAMFTLARRSTGPNAPGDMRLMETGL